MKPFSLIWALVLIYFCSIRSGTECRRLRDIPEDVQQLIFHHLDILEMINVIESDEELLRTTRWAYRHMYGKINVHIVGVGFTNTKTLIIDPVRDTITIRDIKSANKMLKLFGPSISKLKIDYEHIRPNKMKSKINEIIEKYCSQSLIELQLWGCTGSELNNMATPMPKLRSLSFTGGNLKGIGEKVRTIFPNMTDLIIENSALEEKSFISHYFPHLEHLTVGFSPYGLSSAAGIKDGLLKNAQLKSLKLNLCPPEFLQVIEKYLPKLENLALAWPSGNFSSFKGELVRFKMVKSFSIHGMNIHQTRIPLAFDVENLVELELATHNELNNLWLDFIVEYRGLKNLRIERTTMKDEQLLKIGEQLRDLREITASGDRYISTNGLISFIESTKTLQKATFLKLNRDQRSTLTERFKSKWKISHNDKYYFMERLSV